MRRLRSASSLLLALLALLAPPPVRAEPAPDNRLREALRAATLQVRALEEERALWQAREVELKAELEQLKRRVATPVAPRGDRQVADLTRRLAEQEAGSARAAEALARCEATARAGSGAAQALEAERARLSAVVQRVGARAQAAEARNAQLYEVAREALVWIERVGWGTALDGEGLLGLKQVELENTAQRYQDRLLEARGQPAAAPPQPSAR
jgi:chromosome segregation ATPase